jgi:hypothetical protein
MNSAGGDQRKKKAEADAFRRRTQVLKNANAVRQLARGADSHLLKPNDAKNALLSLPPVEEVSKPVAVEMTLENLQVVRKQEKDEKRRNFLKSQIDGAALAHQQEQERLEEEQAAKGKQRQTRRNSMTTARHRAMRSHALEVSAAIKMKVRAAVVQHKKEKAGRKRAVVKQAMQPTVTITHFDKQRVKHWRAVVGAKTKARRAKSNANAGINRRLVEVGEEVQIVANFLDEEFVTTIDFVEFLVQTGVGHREPRRQGTEGAEKISEEERATQDHRRLGLMKTPGEEDATKPVQSRPRPRPRASTDASVDGAESKGVKIGSSARRGSYFGARDKFDRMEIENKKLLRAQRGKGEAVVMERPRGRGIKLKRGRRKEKKDADIINTGNHDFFPNSSKDLPEASSQSSESSAGGRRFSSDQKRLTSSKVEALGPKLPLSLPPARGSMELVRASTVKLWEEHEKAVRTQFQRVVGAVSSCSAFRGAIGGQKPGSTTAVASTATAVPSPPLPPRPPLGHSSRPPPHRRSLRRRESFTLNVEQFKEAFLAVPVKNTGNADANGRALMAGASAVDGDTSVDVSSRRKSLFQLQLDRDMLRAVNTQNVAERSASRVDKKQRAIRRKRGRMRTRDRKIVQEHAQYKAWVAAAAASCGFGRDPPASALTFAPLLALSAPPAPSKAYLPPSTRAPALPVQAEESEFGDFGFDETGFDVHTFANQLLGNANFQEFADDPVLMRSLIHECMVHEDTGEWTEGHQPTEEPHQKARYEYARKLAVLVAAEARSITGSERGDGGVENNALHLPVLRPRNSPRYLL